MRLRGPVATSVLCALALGCASPRERPAPGVLTITEEQSATFIRNFNPLQYAGDVRWPARHAMYEPLIIYNPLAGTYVPWLAESYRFADGGRELRFTVRRGARWSDGRPFGPGDVVFTFKLLSRWKALDVHTLWKHLASIEADGQDVLIRLGRPHMPVLDAIAQQPIVPEHIWINVPDPSTFANEEPVATGPFTRVTSFRNQVYEVERNPLYWQAGLPKVKALRFRAYPANEQVMLALLGDELDWAGAFIPAVDRIFVRRNPAHHHRWFPLIDATVFLYANTRRKPLDDVRVRKALSMAIDRELIAKVALHGYTRPSDATGLSDAYARFRDPTAVARGDWVAFDLERAGRLLDEAGLPRGPGGVRQGADGKPLSFAVLTPAGYSDWVAAAQIIARGLRQVGVDAAVRASEYQAWFEQISNGDFGLAVGWSEAAATPYSLYRAMMSTGSVLPLGEPSGENWHRFGLPAADSLLAKLELATDPEEEKRLFSALQHLFVEHAPAIPLFPGPLWGEFNSSRFTGFPNAQDPYAPLSPHLEPQSLLVLTRVAPR